MISMRKRKQWEEDQQRKIDWATKVPVDDVYFMDEYRPQSYEFEGAVCAHRELCHPDMLNCMSNPLYANITANMRTKKKTRFLQGIAFHTRLPHKLDFIPHNKVIAFCKTAEQMDAARDAGATHFGNDELMQKLSSGQIHSEEYDFIVTTPDFLAALTKIRNVLRGRLPDAKQGQVGDNIAEMVELYSTGTTIESKRVDGIPEEVHFNLILGKLDWPIEKLQDNLLFICQKIYENSSSRVVGELITDISLSCPPSDELLTLNHHAMVSSAKENSAKNKKNSEPKKLREDEDDDEEEEA